MFSGVSMQAQKEYQGLMEEIKNACLTSYRKKSTLPDRLPPYKQQRFVILNKEIVGLVEDTARIALNKSLSLDDHRGIILAALKKRSERECSGHHHDKSVPEDFYGTHLYWADFAHDISLMREFFEFIFFTKRDASASKEGIDQFVALNKNHSAMSFSCARCLHRSSNLSQKNLCTKCSISSRRNQKLKTLSLTVPVALSRADVEVIGTWAHQEVSPDILIDFDVDPSIAVGCRLVWNNMLRDFSFNHHLIKIRSLYTIGLLKACRNPNVWRSASSKEKLIRHQGEGVPSYA